MTMLRRGKGTAGKESKDGERRDGAAPEDTGKTVLTKKQRAAQQAAKAAEDAAERAKEAARLAVEAAAMAEAAAVDADDDVHDADDADDTEDVHDDRDHDSAPNIGDADDGDEPADGSDDEADETAAEDLDDDDDAAEDADVDDDDDADDDADDEDDEDDDAAADAARAKSRRRIRMPRVPVPRVGTPLLVVLAALTVVLGAALGFVVYKSGELSATERASRQAVLAASRVAQDVSSYDYRTLDSDFKTASEQTTGELRTQYDRLAQQVKASAVEQQAVAQTTVLKTGAVSATREKVVVLVYANRSTANSKQKQQQLPESLRIKVTMVEKDGRWLAEELVVL